MGIQELNIYYAIYNGETSSFFDNLEALFYTEKFEGKTLEAIWSEVVILEIDGVSLEDYDVDTCSFNYIKYLEEQGELLWSCSLGVKKSFLVQLKYVFVGMMLFLFPLMLFPILNLSNWNIMFFR